MSDPLVSVCVPTRNQAAYLRGAIASALAQDVKLEVLVHDDASTDRTAAVVEEVADRRVRYLRHAAPLGVARNRNSCLADARGRYVAWLDSDDEYLPGALARQVAALERNPRAGIVHGGFEVIDDAGERLRDWPAPFERDTVEPPHEAFRQLIASNEMTTSTVVVRRDQHRLTGGFRPAAGASGSDWDAWLRIARCSAVAYTAGPVARYRQHAGTISSATVPSGVRLRCDVAIARHALRLAAGLPGARGIARVAHAALAAKALDHAGDLSTRGDRKGSARAVALAARLAPSAVGALAPRLLVATARGDDYGCYRMTQAMRGALAERMEGTRYGAKVRAAAASDPAWDRTLERAARSAREVIPSDATVAAVAKWDPTLLRLIGRRGCNFPDRRLMPDGYPSDGAAAVEHLEQLRRAGVSHLVVPSPSFWWLEHYGELRRHIERNYRQPGGGDDCIVVDLRAREGTRP